MRRKLEPGERRRIVGRGYQVRKALGRDEEERVVRIELVFDFEEWDKIENRAYAKNLYPREWIMALVRRKIGV